MTDPHIIERVAKVAQWEFIPESGGWWDGEPDSPELMAVREDSLHPNSLTNDGLRHIEDALLKARWCVQFLGDYGWWRAVGAWHPAVHDPSREVAAMTAYLSEFEDTAL